MQAWSQTFGQLKEQYVRRSNDRIGKVVEMIHILSQDPSNSEMIHQLSRQFHWLAGSGTMYGFPAVSQLGVEGEDYCNALLQQARPFADIVRLQGLLSQLAEHFANDSDSVTTNLGSGKEKSAGRAELMLIAEGEAELASLVKVVEDVGLTHRCARTMAGGVAELGRKMPDGLIIEIPLPDGDGYELVEQVRTMPGAEELPIIIVSKQSGFLDKVRSIHCGADAHFEKPIDMKAMIRRMRYLLDKRKQDSPRILSVEDDPDQAAFIRAFLESAGYQVKTCTDPKNFDSYVSSFNPDLVLLDVMLPGMTGYELARYLRQDERYAALPVIFLTTQGNIEARIEVARAGGDDHLVKPVPPALLLSSVSSRLERSRFLKTLLHKDGLTSMLNHSSLMEQAQLVIAQQKRRSGLVALIILDIDQFRAINEKHGYPGGDRVLISMSLLLRKRLRQSDILGRYGPDQFGIIAEGLDCQEALTLAQRLIADFATISHLSQNHSGGFVATASAGISILDAKTMSVESWMQSALRAVEAAKQSGRNCAFPAENPHPSDN